MRPLLPVCLAFSCGACQSPPQQAIDGPRRLSQTGLYSDFDHRILAPDVLPFEPAHKLWSDAASKHRWIKLPPGTQIDTSDIDHWTFPVGTQFFKEFDKDGIPCETRLVEHVADTGDVEKDWWFGAFVWEPDQSDAIFQVDGAENINGTTHDAPAQIQCWSCHNGEKGHGLGFSYVQLSKPGPGLNLDWLIQHDLLTNPPEKPFVVPGDPVVADALGYLHANCGHCHNPHGLAWAEVKMVLRLDSSMTTPEQTGPYLTAINHPVEYFLHHGFDVRIDPGHPEKSELLYRMSQRTKNEQMPPLATEFVDPDGIKKITDWIESLPPTN